VWIHGIKDQSISGNVVDGNGREIHVVLGIGQGNSDGFTADQSSVARRSVCLRDNAIMQLNGVLAKNESDYSGCHENTMNQLFVKKHCGLINSAPLASTVKKLRDGQVDFIAYVDEICDRVARVDSHIEAMLPEAGRRGRLRAEATELQARYPDPVARPALYGALVAVKDIFHVSGFVTHAGSVVPPQLFSGPEATSVQKLRDAGALILGKSVTTEFAYFEPGPTRNPHNLSHTPGGSSSGSAAAVAAGLCPLSLGSQTIGSVIRPAAFCGIVGFKPTLYRIPTAGLVYFSHTIDQVGFFTQDMLGADLAASVLCHAWRSVSVPNALPVLGVPSGPYLEQAEPEGLKSFEQQLSKLEGIGCTIRSVPALSDIGEINQLHRRMIFAEFAREHAEIYTMHASLYRPRTAEVIEIGKKVGDRELVTARANCMTLRAELEATMAHAGIDLWVSPSAAGPAPQGIDSTGDPNMNLPWTHAGMPVITLPAGKSKNGLPLGLQFVGPFGVDEDLVAWCQVLEARMASTIAE
jgi:Asp-tRNA(Asn)/Glu-tRNA(Gln) amidotransferase A subunit family amidase